MRCFGLTKRKKRCLNNTHFIFCKIHCWQPVTGLFSLLVIIGLFSGLFQDLLSPLISSFERNKELRNLVSVEVESNRREVPDWQDNPDPTLGKSDVLTILSDRQPVKTLEIYHMAKDQKFKDYPPTSPLADMFIPTNIEYQVLDLDGNGTDEIIVTLKNQIYSLHYDQQVNIMIFNGKGELLSKTPYPRDIPNISLKVHNPYSAYRTTAVMLDAISEKKESTTFVNDFNIVTNQNKKTLQFSWVIDNAPYASSHLHQVEEFTYDDGKLTPTEEKPRLYISGSWGNATTGTSVQLPEAIDFLKKNNEISFSEKYQQLKNDSEKSDNNT